MPKSVKIYVKKQFQFPKSLLNSVNECSAGGFMLFVVDETGSPEVYHSFDNEILMIGLRKFAMDYMMNIERIEEDAGCEYLKKNLGLDLDEAAEDEENEDA